MSRSTARRNIDTDIEHDEDDAVACEVKGCVNEGTHSTMRWCGECSTNVCTGHFVTHADSCSACHTEKGGDESYDESEDDFDGIEDNESNTYRTEELDGFTFDRFE